MTLSAVQTYSLPLGLAGAKSDSQNVATKQHSITTTYEKLLAAAEVSSYVCVETAGQGRARRTWRWEGRGGVTV